MNPDKYVSGNSLNSNYQPLKYKDMIVLKYKDENVSYHETIQDAIRGAHSAIYCGFQLYVYCLDKNGNEKPYYHNEISLGLHRSNYDDVAKSFGVYFKDDFGMYIDDKKRFSQEITHRIEYYSKPDKKGVSVSCPACFDNDFDCIWSSQHTLKGIQYKSGMSEIVISKYTDNGLMDIKTISL